MYDVMLDEANQWYQEPPLRKRKLEPSPVEEKEVQAYSSEEDMDPVEREKYRLQAVESCGFDVDFFNHIFNGIVPSGCTPYDTLFAKAGLHCHIVTDMPDWPFHDGMKESELVDNEWIYLYAEAALFSEWRSEMCDYTPFEMKKVMVQTKEDDVESSTKLKSSNAIFYMIFKARGGPLCRGIVRKTSDGRTGHMRLEARCWIDKSN
ncbi:hypothetical protein HID58_063252 [Brassica napus]|uniref:Uncharacterized protein n=1 Tax=Brassica napus TaxID=3708 RepID=A0ABQ8A3T3_BRANA|nr:hypothetical protein HID58_063252 [Brassica napus]